MYLWVVLLTMLVLPAGSVLAEQAMNHGAWLPLIGRWYVFWAVGVRLTLAGARQYLQPSFTAEQIFGAKGQEILVVVRELGVSNFAAGVVGLLSIAFPSFVPPVAISAAIFYSVAGARHLAASHPTTNESIAMASDLFAGLVLIAYLVSVALLKFH